MSKERQKRTKRGKPSYFMSIVGVTLVLFLLGIIGWLILNTRALGDHFKENVEVNVYLREPLAKADSTVLMDYISTKPYVKEIQFTTKDMAKQKWLKDGGDDWSNILEENPLPQSIDFKLKSQYLNADTLKNIRADLEHQTYVTEVKYPDQVAGNLDYFTKTVNLALLGLAVLLLIVAVVLIDNTIRLAMFSNRFTIKTMQMVGATRWFIARPLDLRAILNGALSGVIAILMVWGTIQSAYSYEPILKTLHNPQKLMMLFGLMLVLGILITLISTHSSILKYLRKKLDDLY
ncbi:MAG: FtsX-like permease family protein [Chitinophagaceae bacterium]|nr:MAG: FtsX-like permease family protein [Chitinophagaceae bacterium]